MLSPKKMHELLQPFHLAAGTKILVAVSGGADSLALLDLLARVRQTEKIAVCAIHVNHQLRPESVTEAARVRQFCADKRIPLTIRTWPQVAHPQTGIEAAARVFRYATFTSVARTMQCDVVMTAHHQDDQVETVLFRLMRSGDPFSAAGILPERDLAGYRLIRPLLPVTKATLRAYAETRHLPFSDDVSNEDTTYSRNYIRHEVLPVMRHQDAQVGAHVARFATDQAGMVELAKMTRDQFVARLGPKSDEFDWTAVHTESRAVQKLVLSAALNRELTVTDKQVQTVLRALLLNDGQTRMVMVGNEQQIVVTGQRVRVESRDVQAVQVAKSAILAKVTDTVSYGVVTFALVETPAATDKVLTGVTQFPVTLRGRAPGDELRLANGHHQKLRRWLINAQIPQGDRQQLIVAAQAHEILWIGTNRGNQLWQAPQTDKIKALLVRR